MTELSRVKIIPIYLPKTSWKDDQLGGYDLFNIIHILILYLPPLVARIHWQWKEDDGVAEDDGANVATSKARRS